MQLLRLYMAVLRSTLSIGYDPREELVHIMGFRALWTDFSMRQVGTCAGSNWKSTGVE